jgi:PIN domain nuclease of toxin-antitoxin system
MHEPTLLLDTCALLWLAIGSDKLSINARNAIEHASIAYVSAITAWEISLKASRGALSLPVPAGEWFAAAVQQHRLTLAPLEVDILVAANELPWHHRDPADRFIIATAQKFHASIVTTDGLFEHYDVRIVQ